MRQNVVTIDPQLTIQEVLQLFLERHITGAPVVDEDGRLLGVISQTDLLRHQRSGAALANPPKSYYEETDGEVLVHHLQLDPSATKRAEDIMTPAAFMVEDTAPVTAVAEIMLREQVHRLIVTRGGKLAGIVTSMDLLRVLAEPALSGA
jgi:CBS domain-containing protein